MYESWCRHVCCGPDGGGFVILQESPRGGEDDSVRHGPGPIEDTRLHRLSGQKRQVRKKKKFKKHFKNVSYNDQLNTED